MSSHAAISPEEKGKKRKAAYRTSTTVAIALAVITVIEFLISQIPVFGEGAIIMFLIGIVKAYLVVNFFMHISRVWSKDGGH